MKATVEIVKIGPKQAEPLLENLLPGQRPVREAWVRSLAEDMEAGRYKLSSDAILLIKGKLANGQHRMWAVVESGTTQQFLLMTSDDDELYKILDCGNTRTVGDATMVANASSVVAVSRLALAVERKEITAFGFKRKLARLDLIEWVQRNNEEVQLANKQAVVCYNAGQNLLPKSAATTLLYLAHAAGHGDAAPMFLRHVLVGDEPDTAAFDLRTRLLKMKLQTGKFPTQYYLALAIKCFNASVTGKRLSTSALRMQDGEEFPEMVEPRV